MRLDLQSHAKLVFHGLGYIAGQLELTSNCKQRCAFCRSWRDHKSGKCKGEFSWKQLNHVLWQLKDMPTFENLTFTGGEPQCWPLLEEVMLQVPKLLNFGLSVNTTLSEPIRVREAWLNFRSIRVSLDSVDKKTYQALRGVPIDPEEILTRVEELGHPNWSTMTCVSQKNVMEIPTILSRLAKMRCRPRKVMFLPVLGSDNLDRGLYKVLSQQMQKFEHPFQTNFAEDVNTLLGGSMCRAVPCYAGRVSFHIKANGDLYPCCLIGGEAVETVEKFKFGNVNETDLYTIRKKNMDLPCHYLREDSPCLKVCQWKQTMLNFVAHESRNVKISMP